MFFQCFLSHCWHDLVIITSLDSKPPFAPFYFKIQKVETKTCVLCLPVKSYSRHQIYDLVVQAYFLNDGVFVSFVILYILNKQNNHHAFCYNLFLPVATTSKEYLQKYLKFQQLTPEELDCNIDSSLRSRTIKLNK